MLSRRRTRYTYANDCLAARKRRQIDSLSKWAMHIALSKMEIYRLHGLSAHGRNEFCPFYWYVDETCFNENNTDVNWSNGRTRRRRFINGALRIDTLAQAGNFLDAIVRLEVVLDLYSHPAAKQRCFSSKFRVVCLKLAYVTKIDWEEKEFPFFFSDQSSHVGKSRFAWEVFF